MSKMDSKSPVDAILSLLAGRSDAQAIIAEVTAKIAPKKAMRLLPADDKAFAALVLQAAMASPTNFAGEKVFISHVAAQLTREGYDVSDVSTFKDRLVAAHRGTLLCLCRCDLVEAFPATDVNESETVYRASFTNATYHFVRINRTW